MKPKYFWIKERHSPQFKNCYYVALGQITIQEAFKRENSLYGDNYMLKFSSEEEYYKKIAELKEQGFSVIYNKL